MHEVLASLAGTVVATALGIGTVVGLGTAIHGWPSDRGAHFEGIASVYGNGDGYAWRETANCHAGVCELMDPRELTAAHRTLPMDAHVRVTNLRNGRTVVVRINNRGPYVPGRVIDLSPAAAAAIGFSGLGPVRGDVLDRGPFTSLPSLLADLRGRS